jgi:hypothetical protein
MYQSSTTKQAAPMDSNNEMTGKDHPERDQDDEDGRDGDTQFHSQSEAYDSSSEDESGATMEEEEDWDKATTSTRAGNPGDNPVEKAKSDTAKVRKEKRLAMNRVSARARRKRKKVLSDSLANQVIELTKRNQTIQHTNKKLRGKVGHLESALAQAQATIASLVATAGAGGALRRQQKDGLAQHLLATSSYPGSLRAFVPLQAATPSANASASLLTGGNSSSTLSEASTLQSSQNDLGLFQAHLLAQGQQGHTRSSQLQEAASLGIIRQQTARSQLLEAAGLGVRLPQRHTEQHGGSVTSQSRSFLGQSRVSPHASFASRSIFLPIWCF